MALRSLATCVAKRLRASQPTQPLLSLQHSQFATRYYSSGTIDEHQQEIETLNDQFVEARDEIEFATEDAETTYFNDSVAEAQKAVGVVLDGYQQLCEKLSEEERGKLQRSMGLKMEQLKAELERLDHLHAD